MKNRYKLLVFTVLVVVMTASAVYSDQIDTGWKGYGLYNLNKSEVSILNESDNVIINGGKVAAVYEYTIKNNSGKSITVNFGYPDNGISKFSVHDGSKYLSYKTRNPSYLKSNYGVQNLQTPETRWYIFNMAFTPNQTRTIKVSIEADMKMAENDTYTLNFFKDRSYSYAISGESVQLTIKLEDYKPYNVIELEGIEPEAISEDGTLKLSYKGNNYTGASINYQPVDKMAIDKLNASAYKKPKAIAKAFNLKDYSQAITLCDEYIGSPADSKLSLDQVKFVKAESIRLQNNKSEYISLIDQLDTSKLYPGRIKYKVVLDKLDAYNSMNNDEAINQILEQLIPETRQSYPYLNVWLERNGYKLEESEPPVTGINTHPSNTPPSSKGKGFDVLGIALKLLAAIKESRWTYVAVGVIIGFILGRVTKRNKKRKSVYLFRD